MLARGITVEGCALQRDRWLVFTSVSRIIRVFNATGFILILGGPRRLDAPRDA